MLMHSENPVLRLEYKWCCFLYTFCRRHAAEVSAKNVNTVYQSHMDMEQDSREDMRKRLQLLAEQEARFIAEIKYVSKMLPIWISCNAFFLLTIQSWTCEGGAGEVGERTGDELLQHEQVGSNADESAQVQWEWHWKTTRPSSSGNTFVVF